MLETFIKNKIELVIDVEAKEAWVTNLGLARMAECSPANICEIVKKKKMSANFLINSNKRYRLIPINIALDTLVRRVPDNYYELIKILEEKEIIIPNHETPEQKIERIEQEKSRKPQKITPENQFKQVVYLVRNMETGNLKIGIAINPQQRLRGLQCGNEHDLRLIKVIESKDFGKYKVKLARELEWKLIEKFTSMDLCIKNEWFREDERIYKIFGVTPEMIEEESNIPRKVAMHGRSSKLAQRLSRKFPTDLESLHIKELRKKAKRAKIKYAYQMTKPELIKALRLLNPSADFPD